MGVVCMSVLMLLLLCVYIECRYAGSVHDKDPVRPDSRERTDALFYKSIQNIGNISPRGVETGTFRNIYTELSYIFWILSGILIPHTSSCDSYKNFIVFSNFRTRQLPRYCNLLKLVCSKTPVAVQSSDCFVRYTAVAVQVACCSATTQSITTTTTTTQQITTTELSTTTLPTVQNCGRSFVNAPRIVGGTTAQECEFPWLVFVANVSEQKGGCGGSILNARQILTAAHCVSAGRRYSVEVGKWRTDSSTDKFWNVIPVLNVKIHEAYDSSRYYNDIAVLTLERPISFGVCAQPICLPERFDVPPAAKCTVAGWGHTQYRGPFPDVLQKVDLSVYLPSVCRKRFGESVYMVDEGTLCSDNDGKAGRGTCQADSGSPLVCSSNGVYTQFGLVSSGRGCASAGEPNFLTFVPFYRNWINGQLIGQ